MGARIEITLEELYKLHKRAELGTLQAADYPICAALISQLIAKHEARIRRLAKRAASETETTQAEDTEQTETHEEDVPDADDEENQTLSMAQSCSAMADDAAKPTNSSPDGVKPKVPGHGRNGAAAYTSAEHFSHVLVDGVIGSRCTCGDGRMHGHRETITIHIAGQPLFAAEAHHYEQARCRICGRVVKASGPDYVQQGIGKSVVYGYPACAMLIVMHYFAGAPFKRLESLHQSWGIPLADANQWEVVNKSDELLRPLFDTLERVGMQTAINLAIDDTGSMVISIMRQIKAEIEALEKLGESTKNARTGINATGVRLETPQGIVIIYATGLHHAGEILDRLMKHREAEAEPLIKITDGASKNFAHCYEDHLVEAVCNAHAFLKFQAIKDKHPEQYAVAGEIYKQIFDNDDVAKARGMTPQERMDYHAKHSKPLLERLKTICRQLVSDKLVEPNSALWEPVSFVINQWPRLTRFYEKPGVPLHTNLVEQLLITPVRYLAGSFNYQTTNGAGVGDRHMSLVASARANDVEPVAYIEHCLRNHEDLAKRPEYYLPWVYRNRYKNQTGQQDPPPIGVPSYRPARSVLLNSTPSPQRDHANLP